MCFRLRKRHRNSLILTCLCTLWAVVFLIGAITLRPRQNISSKISEKMSSRDSYSLNTNKAPPVNVLPPPEVPSAPPLPDLPPEVQPLSQNTPHAPQLPVPVPPSSEPLPKPTLPSHADTEQALLSLPDIVHYGSRYDGGVIVTDVPVPPPTDQELPTVTLRRRFDYPTFLLPFPNFPPASRDSDLDFFRKHPWVAEHLPALRQCQREGISVCQDASPDVYVAFHTKERYRFGQIDVVKNGHLTCRVDGCRGWCGWQATAYSDEEAYWLKPYDARAHAHRKLERAIYMVVPEGWAFQHWLPDVGPKIAQGWEFIQQPDVKILSDAMKPQRSPTVPYMWAHLQLTERIVTLSSLEVAYDMDELIHNCIVPAVHPILLKRFQEICGVKDIPAAERKRVLWMSRATGAVNPGRHVLNEDAVLTELRAWAAPLGLEVEVFQHSKFTNASAIIEYFNGARAIIGPHGGAMFNLMFAPRDTVVVEFMPREMYEHVGGPFVLWQLSASLNHVYWRVHAQASGQNMIVDIPQLLELLSMSVR